MKLVYLLKDTESSWQNNELRYSLRSVERYVPDADVTVVTDSLPAFLNPDHVRHIRCKDGNTYVTMSTLGKMLTAAKQLNGELIVMNDDIIFLNPQGDIVPTARGMLKDAPAISGRKTGEYADAAKNTMRILNEAGIPEPFNYATHRPQPVSARAFRRVMEFHFKEYKPLLWYTFFANREGLKPRMTTDCKTHTGEQFMKMVATSDVVSLGNFIGERSSLHAPGEVRAWLRDRFPFPSRFEVSHV